jgi:hypothetical protein
MNVPSVRCVCRHPQRVQGISNILRLYSREVQETVWDATTGMSTVARTVFDTDGTNLAAVLAHPFVDHRRTISNDPVEVFEVRFM